MKKITYFLVRKKYIMPVIFAALCVLSVFLLPLTKVNYDGSKYLPEDTNTTKGLQILYDEFGDNGSLSVMVKNVTISEAVNFKKRIKEIDNIENVVWLDDFVLPLKPDYIEENAFWENYFTYISFININEDMAAQLAAYYSGDKDTVGDALYAVIMTENDSHSSTVAAIDNIDKLGKVYFDGPAAKAYNNINVTFTETLSAILIIIPVAILILLIATKSYLQPILFLLITGVSVLINMGTNAIFGEISYITQATSAILQMALSIDYIIILSNRYEEEKRTCADKYEAMSNAVSKSIIAIIASALTTIAGFVAMMSMRYTIGFDMGIVLAKGITLSLLTVFLLMPSVYIIFDKLIEKTTHKTFKLSFEWLFKALKKSRYVVPVLLAALIGLAAYAQSNNIFVYGDSATMGGKGSKLYEDRAEIEKSFGTLNQLIILSPKENMTKEEQLINSLEQKEYITMISSPYKAQSMLQDLDGMPEPVKAIYMQELSKNFISENYFRIILNLNVGEEGKETTSAIEEIENIIKQNFDNYYLLGASPSVIDIKTVTDYDYNVITAISVLLVLLIVVVAFKSIVLPLLLIFVIQGSIWLNFAYPYLFNEPIIFIGCLMVSCIQLGATIDYGILLSDRYMFFRKTMDKFSATLAALQENKHTIITSAAVMSTAGFVLSLTSSMPGIAMIGVLVGRGALTSGLLVLTLLPQLYMLLDKGIKYTTYKPGFLPEIKSANKEDNSQKKF